MYASKLAVLVFKTCRIPQQNMSYYQTKRTILLNKTGVFTTKTYHYSLKSISLQPCILHVYFM